jgi:hypothetical protein
MPARTARPVPVLDFSLRFTNIGTMTAAETINALIIRVCPIAGS